MKKLDFLKNSLIANKGLFDNTRIYENTVSAFNRAIKYNFIIHIDLRVTSDGVFVAFHDDDTKRMLHVEDKIENITYDELFYMAKYKIPDINAILECVNGNVPIIFNIMSKNVSKTNLEALAKILDNYKGEFTIQSFNIKIVKWFYKNRPDYIIGYTIGRRNYNREYLFKKYDYLSIRINLYGINRIKRIRSNKLVIGFGALNENDVNDNEHIYDNLVCDNLLDITNNS